MHEATVTIRKLWPPYKAGDKRTSLEDTEGNKYRLEIMTGAGFHDGDVVNIGYTNEVTAPEFGAKEYKFIKKMKATGNGAAAPLTIAPRDIGPHGGMWEQLAFKALQAGMTASQVIIMGIEARQAAREIVKTNLDGKLPVQPEDPNDSLEF